MVTLFSGILILGILVFVHEFGHFTVAKLCGVKVLKFSLGFGPKLFSYQWGETEYMISAIPLGGYVQMFGEGGGEEGETAELSEADRQRSFAHKPLHHRFAIVAAGPLMNLALPFLLLPISYLIGVNVPRYLDGPPCAGYVIPGSEAEQIGFQAGDCIVSVNGDQVETWNGSFQIMVSHAGAPLELLIDRAGSDKILTLASERDDLEELSLERLGLLPPRAAVVGSVADNYPAARAGVKPGDRILAINQQPVSSWYDVRPLVLAAGGSELRLLLERDGQQLELSMTPEKSETDDGDYIVGVSPEQMVVFKRYSLGKAIEAGYRQTIDLIQLTLVFIQKLFSGQVSAKKRSGCRQRAGAARGCPACGRARVAPCRWRWIAASPHHPGAPMRRARRDKTAIGLRRRIPRAGRESCPCTTERGRRAPQWRGLAAKTPWPAAATTRLSPASPRRRESQARQKQRRGAWRPE
jgi:regulator of sigma E protease